MENSLNYIQTYIRKVVKKDKKKVVEKSKRKTDFKKIFSIRLLYFVSITKVMKSQYNAQLNLKKSLPPNHFYFHMDFSKACTCPSEEKIQEY